MGLTKLDIDKIKLYLSDDYSDEEENYVQTIFSDRNKENDLRSFLINQLDELPQDDNFDYNKLNNILYKIHYELNSNLDRQTAQKKQSSPE